MTQLEIWVLPGYPLKEADWLSYGYTSLPDYIEKLRVNHTNHMKKACKICAKVAKYPLVSFGIYTNGTKEVKLECQTLEDLPTTNIEGVLEFN